MAKRAQSTPALQKTGLFLLHGARLRTIAALAAIVAAALPLGALDAQQPPAPVDGERLATGGASTDAAVAPGTSVKAIHLRELRTRINELRDDCGLGDTAWTDPDIVPGATPVRAVHFTQLRTAIEEAYRACNLTPPAWDEPIMAGVTIRAEHVSELLRAAPLPPARYRMTFVASWSESTHPDDFPDNPHFSPLIGATHRSGAAFWMPRGLASPGMENMAEAGSVSPLDDEIRVAVTAGRAGNLILGDQLRQSPGSLSEDFEVTLAFPHVTLVTMVAPSPDWFLGVYDLPLVAADGRWRDEAVSDLRPWDAGTDSGSSYESPDEDTMPQAPIAPLQGPPVSAGGSVAPFGRFVFRRIQ